VFFPEHGVRYVSVNDGVDTASRAVMDITPFRNLLNDMYAADVSAKVRTARRARFVSGKFLGNKAPCGYTKDPADHNHLVVDEEAAAVVRVIFERALAGDGIGRI
jgi:DNA invertase Pin-like site-specific DNA recombinase